MATVKTSFQQVSGNNLFMLVFLGVATLHLGAIQRKICFSIYIKWTTLLFGCIRGMIGKYSLFLIWRNKMVFQWKTFLNKIALMGFVRSIRSTFEVFPQTYSQVVLTEVVNQDYFCSEEQAVSVFKTWCLTLGLRLEISEFSWAQAATSFSFHCHTLELWFSK